MKMKRKSETYRISDVASDARITWDIAREASSVFIFIGTKSDSGG